MGAFIRFFDSKVIKWFIILKKPLEFIMIVHIIKIMEFLTNISELMRYNITYMFVGVCIFLLFSPKLRVAAFVILVASFVNISIEPFIVALGRIQEETREVVPKILSTSTDTSPHWYVCPSLSFFPFFKSVKC